MINWKMELRVRAACSNPVKVVLHGQCTVLCDPLTEPASPATSSDLDTEVGSEFRALQDLLKLIPGVARFHCQQMTIGAAKMSGLASEITQERESAGNHAITGECPNNSHLPTAMDSMPQVVVRRRPVS